MPTALATLVLNTDGNALDLTRWGRAVWLVREGKADLVEVYDRLVCPGLYEPAVIRLREFVSVARNPHLTRKNVLARDAFTCQFCGLRPLTPSGRPAVSELNIDHVVPKAQAVNGKVRSGGRVLELNSWANLVASCFPCNARKRNRTPEQAGMTLRRAPRVPTAIDGVRIALSRTVIPDEWSAHLPPEWRGYWDAEMDPH